MQRSSEGVNMDFTLSNASQSRPWDLNNKYVSISGTNKRTKYLELWPDLTNPKSYFFFFNTNSFFFLKVK